MPTEEKEWATASSSERDEKIVKYIRNNTITPADLALCMEKNQIIPRIHFAVTAVTYFRDAHLDEVLKRSKHGWSLLKTILDRCIHINQSANIARSVIMDTALRCRKYGIVPSAILITDAEVIKCAGGNRSKDWVSIFNLHRSGNRSWAWMAKQVVGAPKEIHDLAYSEAARIVPGDLLLAIRQVQWMVCNEPRLSEADTLKRVWNVTHTIGGVQKKVFRHPAYASVDGSPPLDDSAVTTMLARYVKGVMTEWLVCKWSRNNAKEIAGRERLHCIRKMSIMFVERVALRVPEPNVTQFFQEVYKHGSQGVASATTGWSMIRRLMYGAGEAVTMAAVKDGQRASNAVGWLGYRITSRVGRLLAVSGGVWSLAYDAIRSEDIDWLVTSCTLLPPYSRGTSRVNPNIGPEHLNRYGLRVASAVVAMCSTRCTQFTKQAMFLMAAGGYLSTDQIEIGGNHNLKRNALYSAQFASVAHGLAFIASTSSIHLTACCDLFKSGFVFNPREHLFPRFDTSKCETSKLSETMQHLATRFKKPVLSHYDRARITTAWLCMVKANVQEDSLGYCFNYPGLPAEIALHILLLHPYTQFYPEAVLKEFEPNVRFGHQNNNLVF
jgi:hypothetical protein